MTGNRRRKLRQWLRKRGLGLVTASALLVLSALYLGVLELSRPHVTGDRLRLDVFVELASTGRIRTASILDEDSYVVGTYSLDEAPRAEADATSLTRTRDYNTPLVRGSQRDLLELLLDQRVPVTVDQQVGKRVASLATILLPSLVLVVLFAYMVLSHRRGTGLFGIGSGSRRFHPDPSSARFADVAGQDAAVRELREVTEFLADPDRFVNMGVQMPKGILLYGPPGCGKTLLARALAGEAGATFYSITGSDFVELYVGVGASRVRELFREARENAPAVVFVDELDSVGRARAPASAIQSQPEQEQALNQVLAEMDGFSTAEGVIVLAATNRPDVLDPALLRPGRFDRMIGLERPDEAARLAVLEVHARRGRLRPDVDLAALARRARGMTGADLAGVMNEAALLALRVGKLAVGQEHLDAALARLLDEPERQRRLSMRERTIARRPASEGRVTFADLAGVDDALEELAEVREYLASPERFEAVGAQVPRGILLAGPPGCGKTLLARAVAGEANAAFLSAAGSEFVEVFAGQGAARVRELFAEAASVAPAIVFIDEIDAIGARRSGPAFDGNREQEQTLNQVLVEMDGFAGRGGVIVMAATNRPDILDPALVRPGRFDRAVLVSLPDRGGRARILELHSRGKPIAADVDYGRLAGMTRGFSGADLANVVNEAALLTVRRGGDEIFMDLLEEGVERGRLGVTSRGTLLSDEERRRVAYHEAGHALAAAAIEGAASAPHRLSILARSGALGRCSPVEPHDHVVFSRPMLMNRMAVLLAGWAAERLVFGHTGSTVADDLERVGDLGRRMVRQYGMSDALGPIGYPGPAVGDGRSAMVSEEVARTIDVEVRSLVDDACKRVLALLSRSRPHLDTLAELLVERETLSGRELERILAGATLTG